MYVSTRPPHRHWECLCSHWHCCRYILDDALRLGPLYDIDGDGYVTFEEYSERVFGAEIEGTLVLLVLWLYKWVLLQMRMKSMTNAMESHTRI